MGRGKSFKHKQKGHPENVQNTNNNVAGKDRVPDKLVADFATYEAYKNSNDNED